MKINTVGLLQMTSALDWRPNLDAIEKAARSCAENKVKYLFLPECFLSMSNGKVMTPYLIDHESEYFHELSNVAKTHQVFLLAGSAATKTSEGVVNRVYNLNDCGELIATYDKRKLFSCDLGKGKKIDEGNLYIKGNTSQMLQVEDLKIGLGVCFDVRFPSLAWDYRIDGANVLTYSSAFTVPTGKAHWHTLLRARAIETQCFVIAPAQWGKHNDDIETYGHSLVVDPWGEVLLDAGSGEGLHFCDIDLTLVAKVRSRVLID